MRTIKGIAVIYLWGITLLFFFAANISMEKDIPMRYSPTTMLILTALFLAVTIPVHISWHRDLEKHLSDKEKG